MDVALFQIGIIVICCVFVVIKTCFIKSQKAGYRSSLYLFVLAGIISYVMKNQNWIDFSLLLLPVMILFQFEGKLR